MNSRVLSIARGALLIWGALSLLGVIVVASLVLWHTGPGNRDKTEAASPRDVRFVLNGCQLGDQRIEKVLHSHVSARSFTGDHLDAHAIKITHVDVVELTASTDELRGRWYRGDQLPDILDAAVGFAGGWLYRLPWFPGEAELRSAEFYVYPWSIHCHGVRPSAAELIFVRPSDRMVFYFSGKT